MKVLLFFTMFSIATPYVYGVDLVQYGAQDMRPQAPPAFVGKLIIEKKPAVPGGVKVVFNDRYGELKSQQELMVQTITAQTDEINKLKSRLDEIEKKINKENR